MTMLIPFWVWILLGLVVGWWLRGFLGRKLSFLGFLKKKGRKKKKRPSGSPSLRDQEVPDRPKTSTEKAKSAIDKVTGILAKPWERLLGDFKDEEDDDE